MNMLAAKTSEIEIADTIHSYLSDRFPAYAPFSADTPLLEEASSIRSAFWS